ncbi:MAG: hypothetical protein GY749_47750, partial [Desulfobacteraceae bacterium]|nr:hypothetical protein [Desulfobacteraceae bacterium]
FTLFDEYTRKNPGKSEQEIDRLTSKEWRDIILQHLDTLLEQNEHGSVLKAV